MLHMHGDMIVRDEYGQPVGHAGACKCTDVIDVRDHAEQSRKRVTVLVRVIGPLHGMGRARHAFAPTPLHKVLNSIETHHSVTSSAPPGWPGANPLMSYTPPWNATYVVAASSSAVHTLLAGLPASAAAIFGWATPLS
jgi:hypothetical protein